MSLQALKDEAKSLNVPHWHTYRKVETLRQAILDHKASMSHPDKEVSQDDKPTNQEAEGNKGFIEAAKEEQLYPFPNKKGDRIGLYRRVNKEVYIRPGEKDSSFEFVRWAN